MPDTTGTRPLSWYASCAPDYLWEEDDEADREERQRWEDEHCDLELQRRREK